MTKFRPSTVNPDPPYTPGNPLEEGECPGVSVRYVPTYRKLVLGPGFTEDSGGDLSKDRKIHLRFGTEEGTVVEGNDVRLSDARPWNAPRASLEELQDGTEESPRQLSPSDLLTFIESWWANSEFSGILTEVNLEATKNSTDEFLLNRENHQGKQPMHTIEGLEAALNTLGLSVGALGNYFAKVKHVDLVDGDEYTLVPSDVGKILVFNTSAEGLKVKMGGCLGSLGDEIYFVAPESFKHSSDDPINFFTLVPLPEGEEEEEAEPVLIPPVVAGGLVPSFFAGRSIVCLKKIFRDQIGMGNWLLFGDLASEASE